MSVLLFDASVCALCGKEGLVVAVGSVLGKSFLRWRHPYQDAVEFGSGRVFCSCGGVVSHSKPVAAEEKEA
jgi:hypothetical protein